MKLYNVADRISRLTQWRSRFAFRPTMLNDGTVVWLERVERRLEGGKAHFDGDGLIRMYEYRRPLDKYRVTITPVDGEEKK